MKVFVEVGDKYLLLTEGNDYSNEDNDKIKTEMINEAMNQLENKKLNMEAAKQYKGGYKVLKLGTNPKAGRMRYW